nr:hypothetical protein [Tanacetum cinerariifolium]
MIFGIGHIYVPVDCIFYNVYFLAPRLEIVYGLYFWDDLAVGCPFAEVKENQEKDKIGSKSDKNGNRVEARNSQKQFQSRKQEKQRKYNLKGQNINP